MHWGFRLLKSIIDFLGNMLEEVGAWRIVLVVIDGLGTLELNLPRFEKSVYETVFPSTTTAFIYTMHSLLPPEKHCFLEWYMRFRGRVIAVPPWMDVATGRTLELGVDVSRGDVFPFKSLSEKLSEEGFSVAYYTPFPESTLTRAVSSGARVYGFNFLSQALPDWSADFIVVYWHAIDSMRHECFLNESVLLELEMISLYLRKLAEKMPRGTKLYVATDHGLVECRETIMLPEVNSTYPVGGGRVAFYKNSSKNEVYEKLVENNVNAEVLSINEVYGGSVCKYCIDRYGETIVIAGDNVCFKYPFEPREKKKKAAHGGATPGEKLVNTWCYEKL